MLFVYSISGNTTYTLSILAASLDVQYLVVNAPWIAGASAHCPTAFAKHMSDELRGVPRAALSRERADGVFGPVRKSECFRVRGGRVLTSALDRRCCTSSCITDARTSGWLARGRGRSR